MAPSWDTLKNLALGSALLFAAAKFGTLHGRRVATIATEALTERYLRAVRGRTLEMADPKNFQLRYVETGFNDVSRSMRFAQKRSMRTSRRAFQDAVRQRNGLTSVPLVILMSAASIHQLTPRTSCETCVIKVKICLLSCRQSGHASVAEDPRDALSSKVTKIECLSSLIVIELLLRSRLTE